MATKHTQAQTDKIRALIEDDNDCALDAMQIRGNYRNISADIMEYVGYDYSKQCWIEHRFYVACTDAA